MSGEHYVGSCPPGQHCCLCSEDALKGEIERLQKAWRAEMSFSASLQYDLHDCKQQLAEARAALVELRTETAGGES